MGTTGPSTHTHTHNAEFLFFRLGSLGEGCDDGCQGTVLDVVYASPFLGTLSLYFVDVKATDDANLVAGLPAPTNGSALVVRALDLETGALVAPEKLSFVDGAQSGAYWSIRYPRSLRLRIMPHYGAARVSALFWD